MNNYNIIADVYGWMKKLVFFDTLEKQEIEFLLDAPKGSSLLVIGCGHANFLKYLNLNEFSNIVLVDKSSKMLKKAKKRFLNKQIVFINEDWLNLDLKNKFDIVALPFILDCIPENQIKIFFEKAISQCTSQGRIVITDFEMTKNKNPFNFLLIHFMYVFFSFTTHIGRLSTPNYEGLFRSKSIKKIGEKSHTFLPIFTSYYRKL